MSDESNGKNSTQPGVEELLVELKGLPLYSPRIEPLVKALAETGCAEVVEPLTEILYANLSAHNLATELRLLVRQAVAKSLKQICSVNPHALTPVVEKLKNKDSRKKAMEVLEAIYWWKPQDDTERAWFVLAQGLFAYYKEQHWEDLSRMGEPAVEPVATVLREYSQDYSVQERALRTLGTLQSPVAVEILIATLADQTSHLRHAAAASLGEQRAEDAVPPLASAANERDRALRWSAISALDKIESPKARDSLIKILKEHQDPEIRLYVAIGLGRRNDPVAVEPLMLALRDQGQHTYASGDGHEIVGYVTKYVRTAAAEALGLIGDVRAIEPLLNMETNDLIQEVRDAAHKALRSIQTANSRS